MRLFRATREKIEFELTEHERFRLLSALKLYPLVPVTHHRLSSGASLPSQAENQEWLEKSIKAQQAELQKQLASLGERKDWLKPAGKGFVLSVPRADMEWILQVLNDVRVGTWLALGAPDGLEEEMGLAANPKLAERVVTLHVTGLLQETFIEAMKVEEAQLPASLDYVDEFPDPRQADADGLVAIGGDFSVERLVDAYRRGIFPWSINPITWWSPDPRGIIELDRFHVSKSLARAIKSGEFTVTRDKAFREVITACAEPGPKRRGAWLTGEFIAAYTWLHQQGHAHSMECWEGGQLVGGIYGVAAGGFFAGESMFHKRDNASKVALYHLVEHLKSQGFLLFDIQMVTTATEPLGAIEISRAEYLERLAKAVAKRCVF